MNVFLKTFYSKIEKIHRKTSKVIYESNNTHDNVLLQVLRFLFFFLMTYIYKKSISGLNPHLCGPISRIKKYIIVKEKVLPQTYLKIIHFTMEQMHFVFGFLLYGVMFLRLVLAIHYLNSKTKLKVFKILIAHF